MRGTRHPGSIHAGEKIFNNQKAKNISSWHEIKMRPKSRSHPPCGNWPFTGRCWRKKSCHASWPRALIHHWELWGHWGSMRQAMSRMEGPELWRSRKASAKVLPGDRESYLTKTIERQNFYKRQGKEWNFQMVLTAHVTWESGIWSYQHSTTTKESLTGCARVRCRPPSAPPPTRPTNAAPELHGSSWNSKVTVDLVSASSWKDQLLSTDS